MIYNEVTKGNYLVMNLPLSNNIATNNSLHIILSNNSTLKGTHYRKILIPNLPLKARIGNTFFHISLINLSYMQLVKNINI